MRIKTPIPPLAFSFNDLDDMLDALCIIDKSKLTISIYLMNNRYVILVTSPVKIRLQQKALLCEFGYYLGSGTIFYAYFNEHGTELKHFSANKSLPLDYQP